MELARELGELPERLVIFGIEGSDFGHGEGLTSDVVASVDDVVERILDELATDSRDSLSPRPDLEARAS